MANCLSLKDKKKLYNLEYWIGKTKSETIEFQKPRQICQWRATVLLDTGNYKKGKLLIKINQPSKILKATIK